MVAQVDGDTRPELLGRRFDGVAKCARGLAPAIEFRPAAGAGGQVLFEVCELSPVDRVERVRAEELRCVLVGDHASTPRTPASTNASRSRRMPLRMRLLTVPSGCSSTRATSRYVRPSK